MDCQYGVQYKQPKLTNSKCIYLQGSRKKGCLAHIEIREFIVYPDYSVNLQVSPSLSKKQIRTIKENSLKDLTIALQSNKKVNVDKKYHLSLPSNEAHHNLHPTKGIMGLSQKVHPEIIAKIHELVHASMIDPVEV